MKREERIRVLHDCIERQIEGRQKALRDLAELDKAMAETCREYMALVTGPRRPAASKEGER
jgi:hypothetical protein